VRYVHYGHSMADIPSPQELLACLTEINETEILEIPIKSG